MPKIKQLSLHEAHKIAAGEVIERPANIVKELIENALDASATQISLYIEDGGKQLIRVVDNGCGMDEEDAHVCFDKHATSKITHIDELQAINTFGFRGEALASVAAVARVTLITKQQAAIAGIKVSVACSAITDTQPISALTGTDISIHDLFYTIPARKKFLKKQETEWRHIVQLFQAFCLAFPHIHFILYNEGATIHNCPPVNDSMHRFAQLWQHHNLVAVNSERIDGTLSVAGSIATDNYRYDRNALFFFVNNRWVKNFALANALLKGYLGLIPPGKYPMACIKITVDPTLVDINIHPRKEEVAFIYPQKVTLLITTAVKETLEKHMSKQMATKPQTGHSFSTPYKTNPTSFKHDTPPVFTPFDFSALANDTTSVHTTTPTQPLQPAPILSFSYPTTDTRPTHPNTPILLSDMPNAQIVHVSPTDPFWPESEPAKTAYTPIATSDLIASPSTAISADQAPFIQNAASSTSYTNDVTSYPSYPNSEPTEYQTTIHYQQTTEPEHTFTIIGQLHKTYILIEQEEGLFIVDQHAAHERILYEQFSTRFGDCASINLLFPPIIMLSSHDYATISPHLTLFKDNGIIIEPFGTNQFIISSTPVHLKNVNLEEIVKQVVGWIHEQGAVDRADFFKTINEKLHAQLACKAAVKAGDALTYEQMHTILTDLHKTPNRFTCPHGRPTGFLVSLDEIEKKIKRKK